jgi:DNA repair protein RecO (recombination protein O)
MTEPQVHGTRPNRLKRAVAKVLHEPAYILHSQPYRDTSLLLDVFTRHYGRVTVLAKGAKRPYTQWRASTFQTFQTLSMSFTHKSEIKTLLDAEWVGGISMLQGAALISGYYMNEWLRRALARDDVNESLFDAYQHALADLSLSSVAEHAAVLRQFEFHLLQTLGFGLPIEGIYDADARYGLVEFKWMRHADARLMVHGQTLLDLQRADFTAPQTVQESKNLLRHFMQQYIGDKPLHTRNLLVQMQNLG